MAYTPINWQTGDTITAEKLNKMDNGWAVESSSQTYFTETVTTTDDGGSAWGDFTYSTQVTADTVTVAFDGTNYVCARKELDADVFVYGGWDGEEPDFTNYPFAIMTSPGTNQICTPADGTYTISVAGISSSAETSASFEAAVRSIADTSTMPMLCVSGTTTFTDMARAYNAGRILFFRGSEQTFDTFFITSFVSNSITFIPTDPNVTATFDNGVFTVTMSA